MNFSKKVFEIVFISKLIILIIFFASTAYAELKLDSVYPTLGEMGKDLEVTLSGAGFDGNTKVSMYLDTTNQRMIIGSVDTPDQARHVTVSGSYAYVADGSSGLQVIDISNPSNLQIIGSVDTPDSARHVTVSGSYAYVADYVSGLQVIDISNPSNPQIIGSIDTGIADCVTVSGNYAYVDGLQVVDISDPSTPQIIGFVSTGSTATGVTVSGNYAYVADNFNGLQVIDISTPSSPQIIGSEDTPGYAMDVTISGSFAYVADWHYGLHVIDVSDPSNPQMIGTVNTPGYVNRVTLSGGYAYAADYGSGLHIIDISNPSNPQIVGSVDSPTVARGIAVSGSFAYLTDEESGLLAIDISAPSNYQVIGSVPTQNDATRVTVSGSYGYVADGVRGLHIIDISNLSNPQIVGSVDTPFYAKDVKVLGEFAYVADSNSGLQVIGISNPSNPLIIGAADTPGQAQVVTVVGNTAYVADWDEGLQVIDISSPSSPQIIGSVDTPGNAYSVTVSGSFAYVADYGSGLQVIDISTPSNPQIIGFVDTPHEARDVTVSGSFAHVADGSSGLQVIDISNPSNPQIIGSVDTPGYARGVTVSGNYAYLADYGSGVQAIDISNPASPLVIGAVDTPGFAYGVTVSGNYAFVADGGGGLVIVPIPVGIWGLTVNSETSISLTLPSPIDTGHYTLRVFNESQSHELFGAVSFRDLLGVSKAIIVAGYGPYLANFIWEETLRCTGSAYGSLIYQGYTHENIYFLSAENIDVDGDGQVDVDADSTYSNLSYAIQTWAKDPENPASDLVLYMVGHGSDGNFYTKFNETLHAHDLDGWLDDLQATMPVKIFFIYDACQSGTFIPLITPPEGKEMDRIAITSASNQEAQMLMDGRLSFSYQFWNAIEDGASLAEAFNVGSEMMKDYQTACLDANGDGIKNTKDDIIAGIRIGRGYSPLSPPPFISDVSNPQVLHAETFATLWASGIICAGGASQVWAVINPPSTGFERPDVPVTVLPTVELLDPDQDGRYEGTYNQFPIYGIYQISIYAMDQEGRISLPAHTIVTQMDGPDIYETDDTFSQANVVILNHDTAQHHNFHDAGDADWVKFYGLVGQTYRIKASNLGSNCDIVLELYNGDGTTFLDEQDTIGNPQADEILEWTSNKDGLFYVKVRQYNSGDFGENTEYDLEVYRAIAPISGFIAGSVTNIDTGGSIGDAWIKTDYNGSAISLPNGYYLMVHQAGTCSVSAEADGYNPQTHTDVEVSEGGSTPLNIVLTLIDTDGDGIPDVVETASVCLDPNDADTDDDCIPDGVEDANHNGFLDFNETDPCDRDTDGDGIQDGTELGYALSDANPDTNTNIFKPDQDPSTTTDPLDDDSDNDGLLDGQEDANHNGRVDSGETDPTISDLARLNAMPWIPLLLLNE